VETGGAAGFGLLATGELDMLACGPSRIVGAQAGLVGVSDGMGEVHEVLATWSNAMGLKSCPTSLTDRFLGRAFAPERAVLEPSRDGPGSE
jgi:hypothetical protein